MANRTDTARPTVQRVLKRCDERIRALDMKGKKADDAALNFLAGAVSALEDDLIAYNWIGRIMAMEVSVRGMLAVREALAVMEPPAPAVEDDPTGPLSPVLAARGYALTDTAGGCKAWVRSMENGEQVVVTSTDGGSEPTRDDWLIGRYVEFPGDEDAGFFRSTQDGPDGSFEDELADVENTTVADVKG